MLVLLDCALVGRQLAALLVLAAFVQQSLLFELLLAPNLSSVNLVCEIVQVVSECPGVPVHELASPPSNEVGSNRTQDLEQPIVELSVAARFDEFFCFLLKRRLALFLDIDGLAFERVPLS